MNITIEKVNNGYIVKTNLETLVYKTLDEVMEFMLLHYEGLCSSFTGQLFGKVQVYRKIEKGKPFIAEGIEEERL